MQNDSIFRNATFKTLINKQPMTNLLQQKSEAVSYNPAHLLDTLRKHMSVNSDKALAVKLDVAPPVISKIRSRNLRVGSTILIRMHEVSQLSIKELRDLMGDKRAFFRMGEHPIGQFKNESNTASIAV